MRAEAGWMALFLLFLACSVAGAADFADGLDALDRGDYGAALKEFRPLAEGGNARAEYRLGTLFAKGLGVSRSYDTDRTIERMTVRIESDGFPAWEKQSIG